MPKPIITDSKCTGCNTCVDICPMQCFTLNAEKKKAEAPKASECIGCRACEVQCPEGAIKVEDDQ